MKMRVKSLLVIGLGISRVTRYSLSMFSYGEWIVYKDDKPKYYFHAFEPDGSLNSISKYVKKNNLSYEYFLPFMLESIGEENVSGNLQVKGKGFIEIEMKSWLEEFDLLEIIAI